MTTAIIQRIKNEVKTELVEEFIKPLLRDMRDPEGEYRAEFVEDVIRALYEPKLGPYAAEKLNRVIAGNRV